MSPPSCNLCIHNKVCVAYRSAIQTKASFDKEFDFVKLPMASEDLALACTAYLKPQAEGFLSANFSKSEGV